MGRKQQPANVSNMGVTVACLCNTAACVSFYTIISTEKKKTSGAIIHVTSHAGEQTSSTPTLPLSAVAGSSLASPLVTGSTTSTPDLAAATGSNTTTPVVTGSDQPTVSISSPPSPVTTASNSSDCDSDNDSEATAESGKTEMLKCLQWCTLHVHNCLSLVSFPLFPFS